MCCINGYLGAGAAKRSEIYGKYTVGIGGSNSPSYIQWCITQKWG